MKLPVISPLLYAKKGTDDMKVIMSALEHSRAPIEIREIFSFTRSAVERLNGCIVDMPFVTGCVLLSTCNRTELYLSADEDIDPASLLCSAADLDYSSYSDIFDIYEDDRAVRHLMEVAAGLRSRVFGEDQIISQVRQAIASARSVGAVDPVLETLFRTAITAGKGVRGSVRLTPLSRSAAERAVRLVEDETGGLCGKRALIIGNGEMGRTAAALMRKSGCQVTVTLRSYRHGQTLVPAGCDVLPYEKRFEFLSGFDILISTTASPHYTVTLADVEGLGRLPKFMVDLAVPRDIQPQLGLLDNVTVYNVDQLGDDVLPEIPKVVSDILDSHVERFYRWLRYRESIPAVEELKEALIGRIITDRELEQPLDTAEIVELAVDRAVDLIAGGLDKQLDVRELGLCSEKIRAHTKARPIVARLKIASQKLF